MEGRPGEAGLEGLRERLDLVFGWYRGMLSGDTGRLVYVYDPETEETVADGNPIRDIASVWDLEELGLFLRRTELVPAAEASLRYYLAQLSDHGGGKILDPRPLGEPSGIAHSAFLILALLDSALPQRGEVVGALAEAILRGQRPDGSFRIYFGPEPDDGLEFYPGEAMLALLRTHEALPDPRLPASVAHAFRHYRARFTPAAVDPDLLVFHANWVAQYAVHLHEVAPDAALRAEVRDHVFALHDRVLAEGFYDALERYPARQATVEVACGLEGLGDALAIAEREGDGGRARAYRRCCGAAAAWLRDTQCVTGCTARERGGFGATRTDRRQRIDVTGHVLGGWIRCVRAGIEP